MQWWYYLVAIPAAAFLVNGIPHFVSGISGRKFPSPFVGGPPHLDSALHNVWWGAGNFVVGSVLLGLIWPGLGDAVLIAELVALAILFASLLARVFSRQE